MGSRISTIGYDVDRVHRDQDRADLKVISIAIETLVIGPTCKNLPYASGGGLLPYPA